MKYFLVGLLLFLSSATKTVAIEYFVAVGGNNNNPGTQAQPFKTIQHAADLAQPGDVITVRAGTYRERVTPPRGGTSESARITYQAYPGEDVWIKGSDLWQPSWNQKTGTVYAAMPSSSMFTDNVYYDREPNTFKVLVDWPNSLGQVFVDGQRYVQVGSMAEVASVAKSWSYDDSNGIAIHFPDNNPTSHQVEITVRRSIFRPHIKGLGYITVRGFHMYHAATMPYNWVGNNYGPSKDQHGALDARGGHHWLIENNDVQFSKSVGIDVGGYGSDYDNEINPSGAYNAMYNNVLNNIASNNGTLGISASLSASGGSEGHITISGNVVENNNYLHRQSYEEGGIKTHQLNNSIIANNLVRNNFGEGGIWLDWHWRRVRVTGNLLVNNQDPFPTDGNDQGRNLYLEAGGCAYDTAGPGCSEDSVIVDNNIFIGKYGDIRESRVDYSLPNIVSKAYNLEISTGTNTSGSYSLGSINQTMNGTSVLLSGNLGQNGGSILTYDFNTNQLVWDVPSSFTNITTPHPTSTFAVIETDYFGKAYSIIRKAGPIQSIIQGRNQFGLWPKSSAPQPTSTVVAAPVITPAGGQVSGPLLVSLFSTTPDAQIYYTLDGTTPNKSSILYTSPFTINTTSVLTLKAYAVKQGLSDSQISEALYTYNEPFVGQIPGRIEAEDYAQGGEGIAYHDTSSNNEGGAYRQDGVDIQNTSDTTGTYNVGWTSPGEWLEYDVNVAQSGTYELVIRTASAYNSNRSLAFYVDGNLVLTNPVNFNLQTGDWQAWESISMGNVTLSAGRHRLRVLHVSGDVNVNYIEFKTLTVKRMGDVDGDGDVDLYDYAALLQHFGSVFEAADFNNNGKVDLFDYATLISNFGI